MRPQHAPLRSLAVTAAGLLVALFLPPQVAAGILEAEYRGWRVGLAQASLELSLARTRAARPWYRDFDQGWPRSAGAEATAEIAACACRGRWRAQLRARAAAGEEREARGRILEGWVGWQGRHVRFGAGRRARGWSALPATELLLSSHARALDQLWLEAAELRVPGGGGILGAETLIGYLDDGARAVPYPLLWGMRASWLPREWLRLEAQRTILMGGGGRTQKLTAADVWDILIARGENLAAPPYPPGETDQKFAWQVTLGLRALARLCGGHDLEVCGTYAGEDALHGIAPRAPGRSLGARLQPCATVVIEFASARTTDDVQHWYHHKIYQRGYTYRGFWLGNPMGGDARSWRGGVAWRAGDRVVWRLLVEREKRGYVWHRRGTFPHEKGGFWRWGLQAAAPLRGMHVAITLSGAEAWGGDREPPRLCEGRASIALLWGASVDPATKALALTGIFL